ncbi:MAG TPA: hypothetical protein VH458_13710 [Vicinamibacterales bacterium]|jgi:hypothetical protein
MATRWIAVTLIALACTGCFRATTLVTVRPDGSGTIDQEMGMKPETLAMLKGFASANGAEGSKSLTTDMFTEQQAREMATKMGVRFVSGEPVKTDEMEGYRARYAFDDITKLNVQMNEQAAQMAEASGSADKTEARSPVGFQFSRGASTSTLTIRMPEQTPSTPLTGGRGDQSQDPMQNAQALAMVKTMMAGLYVDMSLAVEGRIVKTNAPTPSANRITLLQMDFDKLLQDPTALQKLQQSKSITSLQGVAGLTVAPTPLTIEFGR